MALLLWQLFFSAINHLFNHLFGSDDNLPIGKDATVLEEGIRASTYGAVHGGKKICKCLKEKYSYVKNMEENFAELKLKSNVLCKVEKNLESRLNEEGKKRYLTLDGEIWMEEVKKIRDEVEEVKSEYFQNPRARKLVMGAFPTCKSVKLGKRIVLLTNEIDSLIFRIRSEEITMIEEAPIEEPLVEEAPGSFWGTLELAIGHFLGG